MKHIMESSANYRSLMGIANNARNDTDIYLISQNKNLSLIERVQLKKVAINSYKLNQKNKLLLNKANKIKIKSNVSNNLVLSYKKNILSPLKINERTPNQILKVSYNNNQSISNNIDNETINKNKNKQLNIKFNSISSSPSRNNDYRKRFMVKKVVHLEINNCGSSLLQNYYKGIAKVNPYRNPSAINSFYDCENIKYNKPQITYVNSPCRLPYVNKNSLSVNRRKLVPLSFSNGNHSFGTKKKK